ncbi:hypothetical protein O3P69_000214 [Scylla paramamosain]|uniref:Uncharacterized protein n=1 Tax=Scylla paramamosain TaxID=85552 RepID=A0AAW0UV55_SCYPA
MVYVILVNQGQQAIQYWPYDRVAEAMGMTVNAVRMMVKHTTSLRSGSSTPPVTVTPPTTQPGKPTSIAITAVFDNFAIRRHVHSKFAAKQPVTIGILSEELKRADIIPEETSQTTAW